MTEGCLCFGRKYWRLNAVTESDSYHIAWMEECVNSLSEAQIFSTLDANSGYRQIQTYEKDIDKTALVTHYWLFKYRCMPFGLKNALATFQHAMNAICASVKWQHELVCIDVITFISKTPEVHLKHPHKVLCLLMEAEITIYPKNCHFHSRTIDFLGHMIASGNSEVARETTKAIKALQYPITDCTPSRQTASKSKLDVLYNKNRKKISWIQSATGHDRSTMQRKDTMSLIWSAQQSRRLSNSSVRSLRVHTLWSEQITRHYD